MASDTLANLPVLAKKPVGRPKAVKDFNPEYAAQARKLCEMGATDNDLAEFFNVSVRTINKWTVSEEIFLDAVRVGKAAADERVKRALYAKATGYSYETEKVFCTKDGGIVRVKTMEHVPPSDNAIIFWLKNRCRDEWRDHQEHDVTGNVTITLPPEAAKL